MSRISHAPTGYDCPFCRLAAGDATAVSSQDDLVYRDADVIALVSIHWWPTNPGHVLVAPVAHHENVYDLPAALGAPIQHAVRAVALAMKESYGCTGISVRQNNEPDGQQDVWHYHIHVVPRYAGDAFNHARLQPTTPDERRPFVERLRSRLGWNTPSGRDVTLPTKRGRATDP
jgi:histidine triad (HIT) family protein